MECEALNTDEMSRTVLELPDQIEARPSYRTDLECYQHRLVADIEELETSIVGQGSNAYLTDQWLDGSTGDWVLMD